MTLHARRRRSEEEEESVFVSMTDLMISILFIVMILMAYFALHQAKDDQDLVSRSLYEQEKSARETAESALETVKAKLKHAENLLITYRERVARLQLEIDLLRKRLKEREDQSKQIAALKREVANLGVQVDTLLEEVNRLRSQIADLNISLAAAEELEQEIRRLRKLVAELKLQIRDLELKLTEPLRTLSTELQKIANARKALLGSLVKKLTDAQIKVEVVEDSGILRFDEAALRFAAGQFQPDTAANTAIRQIADVLNEELRCFTLGKFTAISQNCNPNLAILEALQIEGHTDDQPINRPGIKDNLDLSTLRATATYREMTGRRPELGEFLNAAYPEAELTSDTEVLGQPVLSVSGYGASRPVKDNDSIESRAANRRIDLRFIMMTPQSLEDADSLKQRVEDAIAERGR